MSTEHFTGTFEAQTPISHGSDEKFGMEQRLRTLEMAVRENGETYHEEIPVVSGNGLRGQLRDLLAADFLDRISPESDPIQIHDTLSNALYSGGTLQRGSGPAKLDRRFIKNVREHIPPLSLLGTALGDQMLEGRVDVGMLIPIATETEAYTGREADQSVFEFVDETFYTRQDDREGYVERDDDEQAQQMRYVVQVLTPGTRFHQDLTLRSGATAIERACLGHAFELFDERPHVGGMSAVGHGTVDYDYDPVLPDPEPYRTYLEENREDVHEFVRDLDGRLES